MSHKWLGKDFASALDIPETNNLLLKAMVVGHINMLVVYDSSDKVPAFWANSCKYESKTNSVYSQRHE